MKNLAKKLCTIALALSACMTAPVALVACGNTDDGDDNRTCTVKFDAGWGTIYGDRFYEVTVDKNSAVAAPNEDPVYREDYLFLGWNVSGSDSDEMWNFGSGRIMQDTTLHAVWVQAVTITFDARGGRFDNGTETYTVTVPRNGKLTAPEVTPPDADEELKSWHNGVKEWNFDTDPVTRDDTFRAQWELKDEIKTALAPFNYTKHNGGYWIKSVKDKDAAVNVVIPDIVVGLDENAFADCKNLVSVTMHDKVVGIGTYAFKGCDKLKTVAMSANLKSIGSSAFDGCAALESIDIPSAVTEVGIAAFNNCTSLASIELPIGVTEVNNFTFSGCTALTEVKLGANVTQIGNFAFENCTALAGFDIPANLTKICSYAFSGCTSLQSVTIPATCEEIQYSAFIDCTKLTTAELHAQTIGSSAFNGCTSLSTVTFGEEVHIIDLSAFCDCKSITEIDIPNTVTKVGSSAFSGCTALRSVKLGDGVTEIEASTFACCKALKNVELGSGVKSIGTWAFNSCISLLSFTVPSAVEKIESNAFGGCSRLVEVYNLSSATIMYVRVVHTDPSEESIIFKANGGFSFCRLIDNTVYPYVQRLYLLDYTGDSENLVLPDNYNGESYKIYDYALAFNPQLKSVKFSAGVMGVGDEILLGCDDVTELTVDSGNPVLSSACNCVIITAENKFVLGCKASVIPDDGSVMTIGGNVFCHNATIVNAAFKIPNSVTKIKRSAFDGCLGIMRTVRHVRYIDKWAVMFEDYSGSDSLDLELQSGTVGIADSAFSSTTVYAVRLHISSVKFNDELRYVGETAFYECGMSKVIFNDGLLVIGESAFASCGNIQSVVIPDSVVEIGAAAFMACWDLEYIKLSAELTVINRQLVCGCRSLQSIVIPSSVGKINHSVFAECSSAVKIYYCGSADEWSAIRIDNSGNSVLTNATKYYYSETETESGWHYDADGNPTTEY